VPSQGIQILLRISNSPLPKLQYLQTCKNLQGLNWVSDFQICYQLSLKTKLNASINWIFLGEGEIEEVPSPSGHGGVLGMRDWRYSRPHSPCQISAGGPQAPHSGPSHNQSKQAFPWPRVSSDTSNSDSHKFSLCLP
jgi:hypothetical protein